MRSTSAARVLAPVLAALLIVGGAVGIYEVGNRHHSSNQPAPAGSDLRDARQALAVLAGTWRLTSATVDGKRVVPQYSQVSATFSPGLLLFDVGSHTWDFPVSPASGNTFRASDGGVDASGMSITGAKDVVKQVYQELDRLDTIVQSIAPGQGRATDGFHLSGSQLTLTTNRGALEFALLAGD